MSNRLQDAVQGVTVPPELEARIRTAIRTAGAPKKRPTWLLYAAAIAALLVLVLPALLTWRPNQETHIAALSAQAGPIMGIGLGDHVHCAVYRNYPKIPPTLEECAKTLGASDKDLLPSVAGNMPANYRLIMAHHCGYHGRRFTHLIFRNGESLLSLVIAQRGGAEAMNPNLLKAALSDSGLSLYQTAAEKYEIAAFETPGHLVYVVSDLPAQRNLAILTAVAPSLRAVLIKTEG